MKEWLNKFPVKIVLVLILIILLIAVRLFENNLFYDPFLAFFKLEFQNMPLPEFDAFKLYLNLFLRYFINSSITLAIIYVLFLDLKMIKLTSILLLVFCLVLFFLFWIGLHHVSDYMYLFYVRRFIIQPLFLLLFVPAFYYQNMMKN